MHRSRRRFFNRFWAAMVASVLRALLARLAAGARRAPQAPSFVAASAGMAHGAATNGSAAIAIARAPTSCERPLPPLRDGADGHSEESGRDWQQRALRRYGEWICRPRCGHRPQSQAQNARANGQNCPRPPGRIFACFGDVEPGEDSRCPCGSPPCGCFAGQRSGLARAKAQLQRDQQALTAAQARVQATAVQDAEQRVEQARLAAVTRPPVQDETHHVPHNLAGLLAMREQVEREREMPRRALLGLRSFGLACELPRPICLRSHLTSRILVPLWCPRATWTARRLWILRNSRLSRNGSQMPPIATPASGSCFRSDHGSRSPLCCALRLPRLSSG